jgi:hypothetical protein
MTHIQRFTRIATAILAAAFVFGCKPEAAAPQGFVHVQGTDLVRPDGSKLFIKGTNLGNWLNPEGYMFGFERTNSAGFIDLCFREMVGPDAAADFWEAFKDNYITLDDIRFIADCGANTIRLPFNYRLFTDEDYMGLSSGQDGFKRIDDVVSWCRECGLYLILDMHDAPGGQTGDNIDDGYGYPWLFESGRSQDLFCDIWQRIAARYADEPVILGYELMNEPIATYFDADYFNPKLEPLYKRAVAAIRGVDRNHVILLGGPQWNSRFDNFTDWKFDGNIMYTCHRYGGGASADAIRSFIDFRDMTGLPMYMGEIGHNTDEWQEAFCRAMQENNIGYTFWPYKKVDNSCWTAVQRPENWELVVDFAEADRSTFAAIREARPDQGKALKALMDFAEAVRFENCVPQESYIGSLLLR